jgi:hypothetical protein
MKGCGLYVVQLSALYNAFVSRCRTRTIHADHQPTLTTKICLAVVIAPVYVFLLLHRFSFNVFGAGEEWVYWLGAEDPSRLKEGKDVPGISFWQFTWSRLPLASFNRFLPRTYTISEIAASLSTLPAYQLILCRTEIEHLFAVVKNVSVVPYPRPLKTTSDHLNL